MDEQQNAPKLRNWSFANGSPIPRNSVVLTGIRIWRRFPRMSIDYFLFGSSEDFSAIDLPRLASIEGVALDDEGCLSVEGLVGTLCRPMDSSSP